MATINFQGRKDAEDRYEIPETVTFTLSTNKSMSGAADNRIIHGDNLVVLKSLRKDLAGKIKCAYIDPPYNTGYEDWVFSDNALRRHNDDSGELNPHDAWLHMMMPRLKLIRDLLSEDGVLMVSIDDNEQARLKMLLDDIFGEQGMIVTLIWNSPGERDMSVETDVSNEHEYVLIYAKDITSNSLFKNSTEKALDYTNGFRSYERSWPYNTRLSSIVGDGIYTGDGMKEIEAIFGGRVFDYPKPSSLLALLIDQFTRSDSIILDAFAGSGSTAHAVLRLNNRDGGSRKFILIEEEDYVDTITAERVRRVIRAYRSEGNMTKVGFDFFETNA